MPLNVQIIVVIYRKPSQGRARNARNAAEAQMPKAMAQALEQAGAACLVPVRWTNAVENAQCAFLQTEALRGCCP